jgi:ABC-type nitrate/sulfonate/bicarbonate transport system permease component
MGTTASKLVVWLLILGFFVIWENIVRLNLVDPYSLAAPSESLLSLFSIRDLQPNIIKTLSSIGVSYLFAISIGLCFGLVVGARKYLTQLTEPIIVSLFAIPKIILLPLFMLWLGLGQNLSIGFATFHGFLPITINTIAAMKNLSPTLLLLSRSMGASRLNIYRKIIFPSLAPLLMTGLRLGLIAVTIGTILVELFVPGYGGVGGLVSTFAVTFRVKELYGVTILISIFAIAMVLPILYVERRVSKWRP